MEMSVTHPMAINSDDETDFGPPLPSVQHMLQGLSVDTWLTNDGGKGGKVKEDEPRRATSLSGPVTCVSEKQGHPVEQQKLHTAFSAAKESGDEDEDEYVRQLKERTGLNVYSDAKKRRIAFARKGIPFWSSTTATGTGTGAGSTSSDKSGIKKGQESPTHAIKFIMKVLDPWERPYYTCLLISSVAILYNTFMIIALVTFDFLETYWLAWIILDYVADFIYIFDIFYQSLKGSLQDGILDIKCKSVMKRYFLSRRLIFDLAAVFPTELSIFIFTNAPSRTVFRFNRLLKAPRLFEFLDRTWRISNYPIMARLCTLVLYYVILLHWNACMYFELCKREGLGSDQWVVNPREFTNDTVWTGLYLSSMYWSAMRFTNIGEVPAPVTNAEIIFTIIDMLLAIAVFAGIFGSIEELLERAYERMHNYHRWMDEVKKYMSRHRVPYELQRKVYVWMTHFWNQNHVLGGGTSSLTILPERLQAEINMNAHLNTLRRVRFFQDCEPGLLIALLNKLTLQMFNPGEYICRKGDVGKEMYIVKSGRLSVVGPDGFKVLATLTEGAVFGELSLLNISGSKTGNRRTASIRSNGYSDLFCLSKEDLWAALQDYPEARRVFIEKGRELLIKDGLLDGYVRLDQFALLSQVSQYEMVRQKAEHLVVRMSAMVVGMGASLKNTRDRVKRLENELEKYRQAYRRRKIQLNQNDDDDSP